MKHNKEGQLEEAAFEPVSSDLTEEGKPVNPVLDLGNILQAEPKYEWVDIEYRGETLAQQVLKGNIIHFMDTLDDADLLLIEKVYDDVGEQIGEDEQSEQSMAETVERSKAIKFHNRLILTNFIKGVTEENVDEIPQDLEQEYLRAYDFVNGISATEESAKRFSPEDEEQS